MKIDLPIAVSQPLTSQTKANPEREALRAAARDFETAFLAEAFNHMGLDASKGVGGSQAFSSFLNRAYAERLSDRGGIGLRENIIRSLEQRTERS